MGIVTFPLENGGGVCGICTRGFKPLPKNSSFS